MSGLRPTSDVFIYQGNRYISVRRASMLTGYARDYIGQLCRSKKVNARLIGRNWYLLEEGLLDHKNFTRRKRFKPEAFAHHEKKHVFISENRLNIQRKLADSIRIREDSFSSEVEAYEGPLIPQIKARRDDFGFEINKDLAESVSRKTTNNPIAEILEKEREERFPKVLDLRNDAILRRYNRISDPNISKNPNDFSKKTVNERKINFFEKKYRAVKFLELFALVTILFLLGTTVLFFTVLLFGIEFFGV